LSTERTISNQIFERIIFPNNFQFWYSCQIMRMGCVRFVVRHTRNRLKCVLGIVSIVLEVFAFIIHVLCIYAPVHIHYCDREKLVRWEFSTKRVAGARHIVCQCPFLSRNSLMIFWNSWPTVTGQWPFRLTHGVVADAGWVDRVANISRGYDGFHLTGTYYYTEKGLLITFYACVKYLCQ